MDKENRLNEVQPVDGYVKKVIRICQKEI